MSWQPIATAPSGRMLVVGWHQPDDTFDTQRWGFDQKEDGQWLAHSHAHGGPAPYTHWLELPPIPKTTGAQS